jgi:hypothetical protein
MEARPAVCITSRRHLAATAEGEVSLTLRGPPGSRGDVTLKSQRKIASRWLERGRPRVVTLARSAFELPAEGRARVVLRLPPEQEALLHRMGSIHAVARVATAGTSTRTAVAIHAPARRRSGRRRRAAGAAWTGIALLLAAAPAAHAASWSPPDRLSPPVAEVALRPAGTPSLGIDARGGALATWARPSGPGWRLARRPAGTARFGAQRPAPDLGDEVVDRELPAPLVYGAGRALAIEQRRGRRTCGGFATRYGLIARTGARLEHARTLATIRSHQMPPPLAFAGNRRGSALAAWIEYPQDARGRCLRTRGEVVRIAVHRPATGFGAPVSLRRGVGSQMLAVAVGQRGDMLVAIRRKGALETRSRGPAGRWGAARRLPVADRRVDAIRAAIGPHGAAWLLWSSTLDGVRTVSTAFRPRHATRFGRVRILERSAWPAELADSPARWRLRLAAPERGTGATAAWTSAAGMHQRVVVAFASGDDPLEVAGPVSPAGEDHVLGDLALGAGRRAIAVVSRPDGGPERALVAVARGSSGFGVPVAVGKRGEGIGGEALALDPITGRPTLVWTETHLTAAARVTAVFASTRR